MCFKENLQIILEEQSISNCVGKIIRIVMTRDLVLVILMFIWYNEAIFLIYST